ncbi:hypothetical protein KIN20_006134 [Parelaphostrongylus tenuis]|uniref:Uncharacterized protein n=1 Tax=Parelaphostrongylus tenuis TaxID=148309 RepID=A0AAD5MJQ4_PARTN|nr:hypothetical protein KIN20_006134 [Parelaphostrongylus tenuis]
MRSLPERSHNIFIITSHSAYLCDDRFPKNPVLQLPHTIPFGPHVLLPTSPVADSQGNGHIVSIYMLDHLLTDISVSSLYIHDNEIWSSIIPIHSLGKCCDIDRTMMYSLYKEDRVVRNPVMGMAVVQGYEDDHGRPTDYVIRALSDGSIWFPSLRYGEIKRQ